MRVLEREIKRLREAAESGRTNGAIVGASPAMKRVFDLVERVNWRHSL